MHGKSPCGTEMKQALGSGWVLGEGHTVPGSPASEQNKPPLTKKKKTLLDSKGKTEGDYEKVKVP